MQMDLGLALFLMNGAWPDLELLPVEERPLSRPTVEFSFQPVPPPDFVLISFQTSLWDVPLLRSQS
jgi:hypothetical protein